MDIKIVKLIHNGVLINNKLSLPDGSIGHLRDSYEQWLSNGNIPLPELTKQEFVRNAQSSAILNIKTFATQCRQSIAGNPDHLETAEWSEKRLRALRISDNQPLPDDREKIETEARYREQDESVEQLVTKILAKANRFEHASIIITGMTSAAIVAVNNATTQIDLELLIETLKDKAQTELAKL